MKKPILLIVAFLCVATLAANAQFFIIGSGTEEEPHIINTPPELAVLAMLVNEGHSDYASRYYKLGDNIDLTKPEYQTGAGWIPIGMNKAFSGNFDGAGKTITGLYINDNNDVKGLFGNLNGATISNLNIAGAYISGRSQTGGIAGTIANSNLKNCHFAGTIVGEQVIGGITGVMQSSSLVNCHFTGTIRSTGSIIGGLAGWLSSGNNSITDCYANADISSNGSDIGGIAGRTYDGNNLIGNCYATGSVSGSTDVGGIIGYFAGTDNRLENSAALNMSVRATSVGAAIGRVAGRWQSGPSPPVLSNNVAWNGMTNGGGASVFSGANTANGKDGADITYSSLTTDGTIGGRFLPDKEWTVENGRLPGFGAARDMYVEFVTIEPAFAAAKMGGAQSFTAIVAGLSNPAQTVRWSVTGGIAGTAISTDGVLTIAAGETAVRLTVTATSTVDDSKSGTTTVTVFSGSGTQADPFLIRTAKEMAAFAAHVNAGGATAGIFFKLSADINLQDCSENFFDDGSGWIPIGSVSFPFRGIFDGGGKTVTGLHIEDERAWSNISENKGLFGVLNEATISHLNVKDADIFSVRGYIGGIAGRMVSNSKIENCHVSGEIRSGAGYIGGVVGYMSGSSVTACYVTGTVSGLSFVGGVAGYLSNSGVTGCAALNLSVNGSDNTGRVVGFIELGSVANNVAFGDMATGGGMAFSGANTADGIDGADITVVAITSDGTIGGRFTATGGWTAAAGKLPGFGAAVDFPAYFTETVIVNVKISPVVVLVKRGATRQFTAIVEGTNHPPQTVEWSVEGGSVGTLITTGGELLVASDQYSGFAVTATSTADNTKSASVTVSIMPLDLSGNGVETDPFIINTPGELAGFAVMINQYNVSTDATYFKLGADIDLSDYGTGNTTFNDGRGWIPIGTRSTFGGVFDGGGKTITGLDINSLNVNLGLFGILQGATIRNLNVTGANITGGAAIGGIAGSMNYSALINCSFKGTVTVGLPSTSGIVGGLVGGMTTGNNIINCYANADVSSSYGSSVGGIAGSVSGNNNLVSNCYVTGTASGSHTVGGLIGSFSSGVNNKMENCAALSMSVSGRDPGAPNGRLIGNHLFLISNPPVMSNNVAYHEMAAGGGAFSGANSADGKDGADITVADIVSDGTIGGRFAADGGWTTAAGKLPGFGAAKDFPPYFTETILVSIRITPGNVLMRRDTNRAFAAIAEGTNNPPQTVEWLVEGGAAGTTITANGVLTVGKTETAATLTVIARSTADMTVEGRTTVTIMPGTFSAGNGTQNDPFMINWRDELVYIANMVNTGVSAASGTYFKLGADIDLSVYNAANTTFNNGCGWIPIGGKNYSFSGNFDGAGNTITGLYINNNTDFNGLFGTLNGATISHLNITGANISVPGGSYIGGIAGAMENGRIENCHVSGVIYGDNRVGGVVGFLTSGSSVTNSYVHVDISGSGIYFGGIAGIIDNHSAIQSCYVIGSVAGSGNVGGIAGVIGTNCSTTGNAALNMSVRGNNSLGRVFGNHAPLITAANNVAFNDMTDGGGMAFSGANTHNGRDGADIRADEMIIDGSIGNRFTAAGGWSVENGKLPGFGAAVDMPWYLFPRFAATLIVNKNGAAWNDHGKIFTLKLIDDESISVGMTSMVARIPNGDWKIYEGSADTGETIVMNGTAVTKTLNYYTISFSVANAVGGDISATYHDASITDVATVPGGKTAVFTAHPDKGYKVKEWKENDEIVPNVTSVIYAIETLTSETTVTVEFEALPKVVVTVSGNPQGYGKIDGGGEYYHGDEVTLTATPNEGNVFVNWTNTEGQIKENPYTFTVTEDIKLTANFRHKDRFMVTVTIHPEGVGTVTGAGEHEQNYEITVEAAPNENNGYQLTGWMKNGEFETTDETITFTITEDVHLDAYFELKTYTVLLSSNPQEGGVVEGGGTYRHDDPVTVTATANAGYYFAGWSIESQHVSDNAEYSFTATGDVELIANFEVIPDKSKLVNIVLSGEGRLLPAFLPDVHSYRLLYDCGQNNATVGIMSEVSASVTVDGAPLGINGTHDFPMAKPGTKKVTVRIEEGDDLSVYTIELIRPFDNTVITVWDDVLSVINNPVHNGGYTFTQYQWYSDDLLTDNISGATKGNFQASDIRTTNYTVELTASDGTKSFGCRTPSPSPRSVSVKVWPNPAPERITVEIESLVNEFPVELRTIQGTLLRKTTMSQPLFEVDVSGLPAGIYLLTVGDYTEKIVKE